MTPAPDEIPPVTTFAGTQLTKDNEPEITNEPDDVQEQSSQVNDGSPAKGLADNGDGQFILNESGTSVSTDPLLSVTNPEALTRVVTERDSE